MKEAIQEAVNLLKPVVRRDLWNLGYASVPIRVCAADVGAPHGRPRVFVVAHANAQSKRLRTVDAEVARLSTDARRARDHFWRHPVPSVVRMAHGTPSGMDRVRALGDAVVPQVAEIVGRAIVAADQ